MCECGCGEFVPFAKLQGPGDVLYAISTYLHVDCGCGNPAGVIITRVSPQILEDWGCPAEYVSELPDLTFDARGSDHFIAVLDPEDLRKAVTEQNDDEVMADAVSEALPRALRLTAEADAKRFAEDLERATRAGA